MLEKRKAIRYMLWSGYQYHWRPIFKVPPYQASHLFVCLDMCQVIFVNNRLSIYISRKPPGSYEVLYPTSHYRRNP